MKQTVEKQGWLINGGNDEQYYNMAAASAMLLRLYQDLPVAVCVDKIDKWPKKYEGIIDYIVEYPFGDTSYNMPQNVQLNQWQFYHVTPFSENIVIEADTLILNSVDFPQPDDPKRLKSSDFLISKLTLSKAFVFPKLLDTLSIFRKDSDIYK